MGTVDGAAQLTLAATAPATAAAVASVTRASQAACPKASIPLWRRSQSKVATSKLPSASRGWDGSAAAAVRATKRRYASIGAARPSCWNGELIAISASASLS